MNKINYFKSFLIMIFCILMAENSYSTNAGNQNPRQFIVVIDPGHGGKDPGAINKGIQEKNVVLGIGLKLGKLISENYSDVKVIFTRSTDVFIPLIDRSRIANKNKADLFISVHANICETPSIRGTETFFLGVARQGENFEVAQKENSVIVLEKDYSTTYEGYDPNSPESQIIFENYQSDYLDQSLSFADAIQQQFKLHSESTNRGVKQAGFLVLRQSAMPSVLIETGFLSNPTEANNLNSEDGQQHIAQSVFEAFKKFKNKHSRGAVSAKPSEELPSHQKTHDSTTKHVTQTENQNTEDKSKIEVVDSSIKSEKTEPEKVTTTISEEPKSLEKTNDTKYYSVQIGANTTIAEPSAANFKGLKNVRREKEDKYYRYFIGHENTIEDATTLIKQIKLKFPQAFIVSFIEGKRIPLNVGSK